MSRLLRVGPTVAVALAAALVAAAGPVPGAGASVGWSAAEPAAAFPATLRPAAGRLTVRAVPAYAGAAVVRVRVGPGDGAPELHYAVPKPPGAALLVGDWNGDGASTPAVFRRGAWTLYDSVVGRPKPVRRFRFGGAGRPVVGDWDGDGRSDIGVVRGGVWRLRSSATPGPVWRTVRFGPAAGVPVTGDWDGHGPDGLGTFLRGRWTLRELGTSRRARGVASVTFGRAGDVPLTGDWDGDGRDGLAVVRGSTWMLRASTAPHAATVTRTVTRLGGTVPVQWRARSGAHAEACPTAAAAVDGADAARVVPSGLLGANARPVPAEDTVAADLRTLLRNAERYLVGDHYRQVWASRAAEPYVDVLQNSPKHEWAVRLPAMEALTVAVATSTGAHDDAAVGLDSASAQRFADWLVRSIACDHRAVTPGGWGHEWQSAHWANLAGQAGWMLWPALQPQTRSAVAQMVVSEADFALGEPTGYWGDRQGRVLIKGDTKAEEDAWSAGFLEMAATMMPSHPHASAWRNKAVDLAVASYATPQDVAGGAAVNGVAVRDRLQGVNAYGNYTVENHGRIHPDYMTNIQHNWWAADYAALAGRPVPQAALFNGAQVYGALSTVAFVAGSPAPNGWAFFAPGGTIYQPGVAYPANVYFPQGSDWGPGRRAALVSLDAHAAALGLDSLAALSANDALREHVADSLAMQAAAGPGGGTYSPDPAVAAAQDSYCGREEYAASQLAAGWLARYLADVAAPAPQDAGFYARPHALTRHRGAARPEPGITALAPIAPTGSRLSP